MASLSNLGKTRSAEEAGFYVLQRRRLRLRGQKRTQKRSKMRPRQCNYKPILVQTRTRAPFSQFGLAAEGGLIGRPGQIQLLSLTTHRYQLLLMLRLPKLTPTQKKLVKAGAVLAGFGAIAGLYVGSIIWRVGAAEQELFGRNHVVLLLPPIRTYKDKATPESYGSSTFIFVRGSKVLRVYKPLINGFQHTYGSALASYEIGTFGSDMLFRLNEYEEGYTRPWGRTYEHFLDTRKDLANNSVGRKIGAKARALGLQGDRADRFIVQQVLASMDSGEVISHHRDPRVQKLPSNEEFGCPGLPHPQPPTMIGAKPSQAYLEPM